MCIVGLIIEYINFIDSILLNKPKVKQSLFILQLHGLKMIVHKMSPKYLVSN